MEHIRKEIKNHKIFERWEKLEKSWKEHLFTVDAILIKDGVDDEFAIKIKTLAFQSWFFKFEFIDSLTLLTPNLLIFFGSQEKINFLSFLQQKASLVNKKIIFVKKENPVSAENLEEFFNIVKSNQIKNFGVFEKEKQSGEMVKLYESQLSKFGIKEIDVSNPIQKIISVKDELDQNILRTTAEITLDFFQEFINEVEYIINEGDKVTHEELSKKMEEKLDKSKFNLEKKFKIIPHFFDFAYTPVIQSGGKYDLKPSSQSNSDNLSHDIILMNMAGKYFEMNCNIFRTLLINPTKEDQKNYEALHFLHKLTISNLKIGKTPSEVFKKTKQEFLNKYPEMEPHLPKYLGFGIGYEFREKNLLISPKNTSTKILPGHSFTVISSFKNLENSKKFKYSMHISDTLLVKENKILNLTQEIGCAFGDVGYDMNDEKKDYELNKTPQVNSSSYEGRSRRRRGQQMLEEQQRQKKIYQNQQKLLEEKHEELLEKLENGQFSQETSEKKKIYLYDLDAYQGSKLPKLNAKKIHLDQKRQTILLPINGSLVPFHISCIKNVTKHQEKKFISLRFNFLIPSISQSHIVFPSIKQMGDSPIYIKELTFRSISIEQILQIHKKIKEMKNIFKLKLSLNHKYMKQSQREILRDKLKSLQNLKMRPNLSGRKTVGTLTAYKNGFKFIAKNNNQFILMLSNIRNAIFQPCDENMLVIIHFYLKNKLVIKKNPTDHVQFYADVGSGAEDLNDPRHRSHYNENDEERMEEESRNYYNNLFLQFVRYVEKNWDSDMKFDSPYFELGFYGSPSYNNVFIMPSAYSLISIVEKPFMVIMLEEIELCFVERIMNKIKNFDLTIIFKDYSRPVVTIDNIQKQNLEMIKGFLNDQNIIFIEGGTINIKWDKYLKTIVKDPESFLEQGGWKTFAEDSDSESVNEDDNDSEFKVEEEEDEDEEFDFDAELENEKDSEEQMEDDDYYDDDD